MNTSFPDPVTGATAFVTGATGFVGSHVVEELQRRGYGEIRCLVRSELKWLGGMDIVPIRGTIFDATLLQQALHGVDFVYHVGGVTRAKDPQTFRRENVDATIALMAAVHAYSPDVRRVVVTSSLAVVGRAEVPIADESTPLRPVSAYGRSKADMERALAGEGSGASNWFERLPLTVIRPPIVYGPRERDVYALFQTANRGVFPILGSGKRPDLSIVHVSDLVRGMADAAQNSVTNGNTYFVGSELQYSWRDIQHALSAALGKHTLRVTVPLPLVVPLGAFVEALGSVMGIYPPLNREKAREARDACKMCSSERARRAFGYQQQVSVEEGFRATAAWYRREGWLPAKRTS